MKKSLLLTGCIILSFGINAFAQSPSTSPSATTAPGNASTAPGYKHAGHHSCMTIAIACESAGYRLSKDVSGKNIWRDCVKPIIAGQTISGVTVDPSVIQQCKQHKDRMSEWRSKHGNKMNGTQTPPVQAPSTTQ